VSGARCDFGVASGAVEDGYAGGASPPVAFTTPADQPEGASAEERLRKLKELLDESLISPEDYQRKKALILDEL